MKAITALIIIFSTYGCSFFALKFAPKKTPKISLKNLQKMHTKYFGKSYTRVNTIKSIRQWSLLKLPTYKTLTILYWLLISAFYTYGNCQSVTDKKMFPQASLIMPFYQESILKKHLDYHLKMQDFMNL